MPPREYTAYAAYLERWCVSNELGVCGSCYACVNKCKRNACVLLVCVHVTESEMESRGLERETLNLVIMYILHKHNA